MHTKSQPFGFTLIELLMSLSLLISICLMIGTPLLMHIRQTQGIHEVEQVAQQFIWDAHYARQLALLRQEKISLIPRINNQWQSGWQIVSNPRFNFLDEERNPPIRTRFLPKYVLVSNTLSGNQFEDMSLQYASEKRRHLTFSETGHALMHRGGFVANRIAFIHTLAPDISRHVVMGAGGRLRLCSPQSNKNTC